MLLKLSYVKLVVKLITGNMYLCALPPVICILINA